MLLINRQPKVSGLAFSSGCFFVGGAEERKEPCPQHGQSELVRGGAYLYYGL